MCALVMVAEQGISPSTYYKSSLRLMVRNLANRAPSDCEAFLFSPPADHWTPVLGHNVALWAQISTGIPTVNASSGSMPPHWGFEDTRIGSDVDYKRLRQALLLWERDHPTLRQVCWLRPKDDQGSRGLALALAGLPILEVERVALSAEPPYKLSRTER